MFIKNSGYISVDEEILNEFKIEILNYFSTIPKSVEMVDFDTVRLSIAALNLVSNSGVAVDANYMTNARIIKAAKKIGLKLYNVPSE